MWNVEWELWIGQISDKNMSDNGKIINKKVGVCIYGSNQKVKASIWEIDMRETGRMEFEMGMEFFTMQMVLSMKVTGKIIWKKDIHFIQIKMEKFHLYFSKKTEW